MSKTLTSVRTSYPAVAQPGDIIYTVRSGVRMGLLVDDFPPLIMGDPIERTKQHYTAGASIDNTGNDNLIPNGDFAGDEAGWVLGDGWSIASNKASCDGTQSASSQLEYSAVTPTTGVMYLVTWTQSNVTAGGCRIIFGAAATTTETGNGTFRGQLTGAGTDPFVVDANSTFTGDVDDIKLQLLEITWDLDVAPFVIADVEWDHPITAINLKAGAEYDMILTQANGGCWWYDWDDTIFKWPNGVAPDLSCDVAGDVDVLHFTCDGTYLYGRLWGLDFT